MFHAHDQVLVFLLLCGGLNSAPAPTEVPAAASVQCDSQSEDPCRSFPDLCLAGGGRCVVKGPCEYQCLCPPDGRVGRDCTSTSHSQPGSVVDSLLLFSKDIFLDENHMEKAQAFPKMTPSSNHTTSPATTLQRVVTNDELVSTPDLTRTTPGSMAIALKLTGTIQEHVETTTRQTNSTRQSAETTSGQPVATPELPRTRSDVIKESGEALEDLPTAGNGSITMNVKENTTQATNTTSMRSLSSRGPTSLVQTIGEKSTQEASLAAVGLGLLNLIASAFSRLTNYSSKYYPTSGTNDGINSTIGAQEKDANSFNDSISRGLNKTVGVSTNQTMTTASVSSNTRLLGTLVARLSQVDNQNSTLEPSAKTVPEVTFVASHVTAIAPQTTPAPSVPETTDSSKVKQTSANTNELSTMGSTAIVSLPAGQSSKSTDQSQESQRDTGSKPDTLQTLITDKLQQLFQQIATSLKITTTKDLDKVPTQQYNTTATITTTLDKEQVSNLTSHNVTEVLLSPNTSFGNSSQQSTATTGALVEKTTTSAPTTTVVITTEEFPTLFKMGDGV